MYAQVANSIHVSDLYIMYILTYWEKYIIIELMTSQTAVNMYLLVHNPDPILPLCYQNFVSYLSPQS